MSGTRRRTAKAKANASPAMNFDISSCSIVDQLSQLHLEEPTRFPAVPSQDIPQYDLLGKELALVKMQKEKMALELEVLWLRQSATTFSQHCNKGTSKKENYRLASGLPSRRAFLKTPEDVWDPKSYFMCRLFTETDSIFVRFKS